MIMIIFEIEQSKTDILALPTSSESAGVVTCLFFLATPPTYKIIS